MARMFAVLSSAFSFSALRQETACNSGGAYCGEHRM